MKNILKNEKFRRISKRVGWVFLGMVIVTTVDNRPYREVRVPVVEYVETEVEVPAVEYVYLENEEIEEKLEELKALKDEKKGQIEELETTNEDLESQIEDYRYQIENINLDIQAFLNDEYEGNINLLDSLGELIVDEADYTDIATRENMIFGHIPNVTLNENEINDEIIIEWVNANIELTEELNWIQFELDNGNQIRIINNTLLGFGPSISLNEPCDEWGWREVTSGSIEENQINWINNISPFA